MENTCDTCKYCQKGEMPTKNGTYSYTMCSLTSVLMKPNGSCEYCNKDLSQENICYNCKHYGGGHDWGLFCSKHYNHLGMFNDEPCDDFEKKKIFRRIIR